MTPTADSHDRAPEGAKGRDRVVIVANARMPSARAQSVQLAQAARGFRQAGADVTVIHARRRDTPVAAHPDHVFQKLLSAGTRDGVADLVAIPCLDWIDRVPRRLQFLPARAQEWTFGRGAARRVRASFEGAFVLVRDVEVADALRGRERVAWEVHRVPGGRLRRRMAARALAAGVLPIAISRGVAEDLEQCFSLARPVAVEHDAVDEALVDSLPGRGPSRAALGLDQDAPVVLYAGGLMRWKGVGVLVEAARDPRLRSAQIVIVGGMERDVQELRAAASGLANVRIDGYRPAPDIPAYLSAADVAVVPNRRSPRISSHYTSPLKVFESLAARLPLVVSDLPSLRDVLDDECASFVEAEDPSALAGAVQQLIEDPSLRAKRAEAGANRVLLHTWSARSARILGRLRDHRQVAP